MFFFNLDEWIGKVIYKKLSRIPSDQEEVWSSNGCKFNFITVVRQGDLRKGPLFLWMGRIRKVIYETLSANNSPDHDLTS